MRYFTYVVILLLGFLIGSTCGEIIELLMPARYLNLPIFGKSFLTGFAPAAIELKVVHIDFGMRFLVNFFSWIGLLIASSYSLIKELTIKK